MPTKTEKTFFQMPNDQKIRFPLALPLKFIQQYTKPGQIVFDPFAGYGTVLIAAQKLKRIGMGIEYNKTRRNKAAKKLKSPSKIIHGDVRKLSRYHLPKFDFCFTSPPYMRSFDLDRPFTNYTEPGNYKLYLKELYSIFAQVKKHMKQNAYVLVEVSNTFGVGHPMTTLAWDVAKELSKLFWFERELIRCNKQGSFKRYASNHSYVLVFKNA